MKIVLTLLIGLALACPPRLMRAETPDEWIALGRRIHGGFGSYLVLGIRIGLDAQKRLEAEPRQLDVTYQDGPNTPCPCVVDGIMLATTATPGQDSLRVLPRKAAPTAFGVAVIKNMKTGKSLRYTIPASARAFLDACNKKPERERYDAVMDAPEASRFHTEALAASHPKGRSRK
jgi:formylmethanofuran dehydrogenase subunit E